MSIAATTYPPAAISAVLDTVTFDGNGLVAAIAQQHDSGEVLMMAWMNAEALRETMTTGRVCYWSRSRKQLWRKGETSGHFLRVEEIRVDCDQDALVVLARPDGPACHTGAVSCFYRRLEGDALTSI